MAALQSLAAFLFACWDRIGAFGPRFREDFGQASLSAWTVGDNIDRQRTMSRFCFLSMAGLPTMVLATVICSVNEVSSETAHKSRKTNLSHSFPHE